MLQYQRCHGCQLTHYYSRYILFCHYYLSCTCCRVLSRLDSFISIPNRPLFNNAHFPFYQIFSLVPVFPLVLFCCPHCRVYYCFQMLFPMPDCPEVPLLQQLSYFICDCYAFQICLQIYYCSSCVLMYVLMISGSSVTVLTGLFH